MRSFSGTHDFRPSCLLAALIEDLAGDVEGATTLQAHAEAQLESLVAMLEAQACPRCGAELAHEQFNAGSRITSCRCIPVCSQCGGSEASTLASPVEWPLTDQTHAVRLRRQTYVVDGAGNVRARPRFPGGWLEFGEHSARDTGGMVR